LHQQTLQARTGGWRLPLVEEALTSGNYRELFDSIIRDRALSVGAMNDLEMAEQFRVVRFGGSIEMLEKFGERMSRLT
jgi:hypothetical protein